MSGIGRKILPNAKVDGKACGTCKMESTNKITPQNSIARATIRLVWYGAGCAESSLSFCLAAKIPHKYQSTATAIR